MSTNADSQSFKGYIAIREERGEFAIPEVEDPDSPTTLGVSSTDSSDTGIDVTINNSDGSLSETITTDGTDATNFVTGSTTFEFIGLITVSTAPSGDIEIFVNDSGTEGTKLGAVASGNTDANVAPDNFVEAVSDDFSGDNAPIYLSTIRGREAYESRPGAYGDDGGFEFPAAPEGALGYALKGAFGSSSVTTSDPDSDGTDEVGTHTFSPADDLPSWVVEIGAAGIDAIRHRGVVFDEFELSHTAGEELVASVSAPAARPDLQGQRLTPSYSATEPFAWNHGTVTLAGTDRSADVQDLTLTLANGVSLETRDRRFPTKAYVGMRELTAEVTLDFENTDLFELFMGAAGERTPQDSLAEVDLTAEWTTPETIADTSTAYQLTADLPRLNINSRSANLSEQDLVAEGVELRALWDTNAGYDGEFQLRNGVLSAY